MFRLAVVVACACLGLAASAHAQTILTFEEVLSRARDQAGGVLVARARIAEAEAGLVGVSARFRDNPILEASVGPRVGESRRTTDLDIGLSQQFETGGQRGARVAGAQAVIDRHHADVEEARRTAVLEAAVAFLDGVAANERLRIAEEGDTVSRELLNSTERRYALGDIAAIDVNLARIDAARSAAALRAARADFTSAIGRLRTILRLPFNEPIDVRGTLDFSPPATMDVLRAAVDERPQLVALRAETREAEAQVQLGRALRSPDLGFRVGYEREEANNIVLGGLTIALPAFQRGQGVLAGGVARTSRLRLELETTRQAAMSELETAYAVYRQHVALAGALVSEASPSLDDNQTLIRRSYEAGELNLRDFLLIRRDALETRTAMIESRLEAARSRVMVDYVAGVLR
jgi:cobalt-zinc-cadmium efflux system outer membrane protein